MVCFRVNLVPFNAFRNVQSTEAGTDVHPITRNTNTEQRTTECVTGETQHAFDGTRHCLCCSVGIQDSSTPWFPVTFPDTLFWKDTHAAAKHKSLAIILLSVRFILHSRL
jgi:hypothetical protein